MCKACRRFSDNSSCVRIVLCSKEGSTLARRADSLQRARDRLAKDEHMQGERRDRVIAALDQEIAKLRSQL